MVHPNRDSLKSPASGPLVNTTEYSDNTVTVIDQKTCEFQQFSVKTNKQLFAASAARAERYQLQRTAASILAKHQTPRKSRYRIAVCHNHISGEAVEVMKAVETNKAHYKGLMVCGSVWTCAVCNSKIISHRGKEVTQAMETHSAAGFRNLMITLTFPHKKQDDLLDLRKKQSRALKYLRETRLYQELREQVGYVGLIRALEVTHGLKNGWHPHTHENWFITEDTPVKEVKKVLYSLWKVACVKAGLPEPNYKRGVDVREAWSPNDYLAKFEKEQSWGSGAELTANINKRSFTGRSPFDLLRSAQDGNDRDARLFAEFAFAFHGARQLYWSKGLKELMGIYDVSDEAIAESTEEKSIRVCCISPEAWKLIIKGHPQAKNNILDLAENGGIDAVSRYIANLTGHHHRAFSTPEEIYQPIARCS